LEPEAGYVLAMGEELSSEERSAFQQRLEADRAAAQQKLDDVLRGAPASVSDLQVINEFFGWNAIHAALLIAIAARLEKIHESIGVSLRGGAQ
jgi:hypothetical protein